MDRAHIYWPNIISHSKGRATGTIGRANLDGSRVVVRFISPGCCAYNVAVDGLHK